MSFKFEELKVWQKAIDLTYEIHLLQSFKKALKDPKKIDDGK